MKVTWKPFYDELNFCDMTLFCEDKQIQCHKAVVSSSSPILKYIIKESSIETPFIILEGLKFKILQNLIKFIYKGDATISEQDLGSFLTIAQDLKIKGLSEKSGRIHNNTSASNLPLHSKESYNKIDFCEKTNICFDFNEETVNYNKTDFNDDTDAINKSDSTDHSDVFLETLLNENPATSNKTLNCNIINPNKNVKATNSVDTSNSDAIKSPTEDMKKPNLSGKSGLLNFISELSALTGGLTDFEVSNNSLETFISRNRKHFDSFIATNITQHICTICGKQYATPQNLKLHIQSAHEGKTYSCKSCPKKFKDTTGLRRHDEAKHKGIFYHCDYCEHKTVKKYELKLHMACKHEGITYPCKECSFKATNHRTLKNHIMVIHQGVRYKCDKCDFITKSYLILRRHTDIVHLGISYPCKECDFVTGDKGNFKRHTERFHKGLFYPCDQCDYEAVTERKLKTHLRKEHTN